MGDSRLKPRSRSEIIQGGEGEKDRKRMRRMSNNQKNSIPVVDDDLVVDQILTRLPVKSLMRFKCVCKAWKSIIEHDSHFIDSYNAGSQARFPGLLVVPNCRSQYERPSFFSAELHCADDDSDGGRKISGATIHRLGGSRTVKSTGRIVRFMYPVRGLLCLADDQYAVRIYNVSTCQAVTPWIRSPGVALNWSRWKEPQRCQFGFDPSSGKYKVIFMFDDPAVCGVLTVGVDASWRRIDQVPPCKPQGDFSAYANGSIYWITFTGRTHPYGEDDPDLNKYCEFLMAFDVGSEKFRMIRIPRFTFWGYDPFPYCGLFEIGGCLTVVRGRRPGAEEHTVKMWKFHDYGKLQGTNGTSSSIEAEQQWSEVTLELPPYVDVHPEGCSLHPIPGKDLMIIGFSDPLHPYDSHMAQAKIPSYYSYNMINKTFSKFQVQGTSLLPGTGFAVCAIFAECLFSGTSNLTYPSASVRPVEPIAILPWLSSPPTQQGYRYPAPYIRPVPPRNVPIAIYPWQAPPTRQDFLPPQVGHHVGQFAIAPRGFHADRRYLPPNLPNEQYVEDDWSPYGASTVGGSHI